MEVSQEPKQKNGSRLQQYPRALKLVRTIIGFTVLLVGIALIVLPGPAFIVIPIGWAILATEYAWARHYLQRFKESGEKLGAIFFRKKEKPGSGEEPRVRE
ncbi:PGPGW domain-containing protein [bacterium]|nr:PGPGW domain-containing protein [bacterium]